MAVFAMGRAQNQKLINSTFVVAALTSLLPRARRAAGATLVKGFPLSFSFSSASSHALVPFGWDDVWEAEFVPYAALGLLPGRVVRVDRNMCDVFTADGIVRADTSPVTCGRPDAHRVHG